MDVIFGVQFFVVVCLLVFCCYVFCVTLLGVFKSMLSRCLVFVLDGTELF